MMNESLDKFQTEFRIILDVTVAWGEMDALAHVNNVAYFRYFESSRALYFQEMGIFGPNVTQSVGPILAATACRYKAPLTYPDQVRVGTRTIKIEDTKFFLEHQLYSEKLQRIAAVGEAEIVSYDYATLKKAPLPANWRQIIERIEGRKVD